MKTILAYGDSLTFGANPQPNGPRHAYEDRWPTVLEKGLGGKARLAVLSGCSHMTMVEKPDHYTALLRAFLAED